MSAEKALYNILSTDGGVTQYAGDDIYPVRVEQSATLPAVTYQQISGPRAHNVAGAIGWVESRFQITAWADDYLKASDLAGAIRTAVDGYSGTSASLVIDHIFVVDEGDIDDLPADNSEMLIYGKRIDAQIVFKE